LQSFREKNFGRKKCRQKKKVPRREYRDCGTGSEREALILAASYFRTHRAAKIFGLTDYLRRRILG
jgi:hypothetical protein